MAVRFQSLVAKSGPGNLVLSAVVGVSLGFLRSVGLDLQAGVALLSLVGLANPAAVNLAAIFVFGLVGPLHGTFDVCGLGRLVVRVTHGEKMSN